MTNGTERPAICNRKHLQLLPLQSQIGFTSEGQLGQNGHTEDVQCIVQKAGTPGPVSVVEVCQNHPQAESPEDIEARQYLIIEARTQPQHVAGWMVTDRTMPMRSGKALNTIRPRMIRHPVVTVGATWIRCTGRLDLTLSGLVATLALFSLM